MTSSHFSVFCCCCPFLLDARKSLNNQWFCYMWLRRVCVHMFTVVTHACDFVVLCDILVFHLLNIFLVRLSTLIMIIITSSVWIGNNLLHINLDYRLSLGRIWCTTYILQHDMCRCVFWVSLKGVSLFSRKFLVQP